MKYYKCKGTGKVVCFTCGGSGEMHNENHYCADSSWGNRYVICKDCYGIGKKYARHVMVVVIVKNKDLFYYVA